MLEEMSVSDDNVPSHGLGHNRAPLSERIFAEPDASIANVLNAVLERIRTDRAENVAQIAARAKVLASNSKKLPKELDDTTVAIALDLLAEIGVHSDRAGEEKEQVLSAAKSVSDALAGDCKPMEAGIAPLEKALRPLLTSYLESRLARHNESLQEGDEALMSLTARGASGARATLTLEKVTSVIDANAIPRDLCVPDVSLIEKAIAEGRDVPGIEVRDSPSLRVYK